MSVSNTDKRSPATGGYACNGSVTSFAGTFRVLAETDIQVILTTAAGIETVLTLTTDYTTTPAGGAYPADTFTVTTSSAYASGNTITILRSMEFTQPTSYGNSGRYLPKNHETSFDRGVLQIQQMQEEIDRCVKDSASATATTDPDSYLAACQSAAATATAAIGGYPTAEKYLSTYGNLATAVASIGASEETLVIDTNGTLTANLTIPKTITLLPIIGNVISGGYTLTVTGVSVIAGRHQWIGSNTTLAGAVSNTEIFPEWWGETGTTNDAVVLNSAMTYAGKTGKKLVFESGKTYTVTAPVFINQDVSLAHDMVLDGSGCIIKAGATFDSTVPVATGPGLFVINPDGQQITIRDFNFDGNETTLVRHQNTTVNSTTRFDAILVNANDAGDSPKTVIENINVTNIGGTGFSGFDVDDLHIKDSSFDTWYHGVFVKRFEEVLIDGCRCISNRPTQSANDTWGGIGILLTFGDRSRVINCVIEDILDSGTKTEGVSEVIYTNNIVKRCGKDGIKVQGAAGQSQVPQKAVVSNNIIQDLYPFRTDGSTCLQISDIFDVTVTGNVVGNNQSVTLCDRIGIRTYNHSSGTVGQAAKVVVTGNRVSQCSNFTTDKADIQIVGADGGGHTFVVNNNMSTTGMLVGDGYGHSTVCGNVVGSDLTVAQTFAAIGIRIAARMITCNGNTIKRSTNAGIYCDNNLGPNDGITICSISGNSIDGCIQFIDINGTGTCDISINGNTCSNMIDSRDAPIRLRMAGPTFDAVSITGNTFKGASIKTLIEYFGYTSQVLGYVSVHGNSLPLTKATPYWTDVVTKSVKVTGDLAKTTAAPTHATNYQRGDIVWNSAAGTGTPIGWMVTSAAGAAPAVQTWVALANL